MLYILSTNKCIFKSIHNEWSIYEKGFSIHWIKIKQNKFWGKVKWICKCIKYNALPRHLCKEQRIWGCYYGGIKSNLKSSKMHTVRGAYLWWSERNFWQLIWSTLHNIFRLRVNGGKYAPYTDEFNQIEFAYNWTKQNDLFPYGSIVELLRKYKWFIFIWK